MTMRRSPFFEGVAQMDLTVRDEFPSKLPVFYYDAGLTAAAFPARLGRLRRMMADPRAPPAQPADRWELDKCPANPHRPPPRPP